MRKVAKFNEVSKMQFIKDCVNVFGTDNVENVYSKYEKISMPKRGTKFSAGHDICTPFRKGKNY